MVRPCLLRPQRVATRPCRLNAIVQATRCFPGVACLSRAADVLRSDFLFGYQGWELAWSQHLRAAVLLDVPVTTTLRLIHPCGNPYTVTYHNPTPRTQAGWILLRESLLRSIRAYRQGGFLVLASSGGTRRQTTF